MWFRSLRSLYEIIKQDLRTPWRNDPAINYKLELLFNYPGVWALVNYRIAHALYKRGWKLLARIIMGITQIITNVDIHPGAKIGRRVFIDHATGVVIGETAVVEDDVLIYQGVTLGGVSLDRGVKRHPTVKRGAVIGGGAKVLGNIEIGENARIGANSVVIKSVPANSTAVGIPARVISKGRDKEQLSHNKIPDINKQLFIYLAKRIEILENAIINHDENIIIEKDKELEKLYKEYISTMK
ncbi:MAG: serine O-acetyltransferase [Epsilonproteobacteria bacterium]|nr:serine O-acetyltransferase [Campylobacterota bacterium]